MVRLGAAVVLWLVTAGAAHGDIIWRALAAGAVTPAERPWGAFA